jgi:dihydroorotate dehydrogenase
VELTDWVDGFVVNLSSPNMPGLVDLQQTQFLQKLLEECPKPKPIWIKFSPDLIDSQISELCDWISQEKDLTGAVLTNTSRSLCEKVHPGFAGGLSGPLLFERSLHCVALGRKALGSGKNLIGVGGVDSLEAALKMREAGADLVQVYTAFAYQGTRIIRRIVDSPEFV